MLLSPSLLAFATRFGAYRACEAPEPAGQHSAGLGDLQWPATCIWQVQAHCKKDQILPPPPPPPHTHTHHLVVTQAPPEVSLPLWTEAATYRACKTSQSVQVQTRCALTDDPAAPACFRRWCCRAGGERVEPPPLAELELRLAEAVSREEWDVAVTLRDELKCVAAWCLYRRFTMLWIPWPSIVTRAVTESVFAVNHQNLISVTSMLLLIDGCSATV